MHFPVSLLRDSPTAMGLMSGRLPSFSLINLPPAKNLDTKGGALPAARGFMSVLQIDVGSGMRAASSKCCMRRPEGPAAVPFGKERSMILQSGSIGTYASRFHIGILQYHECH